MTVCRLARVSLKDTDNRSYPPDGWTDGVFLKDSLKTSDGRKEIYGQERMYGYIDVPRYSYSYLG